MQGIQSLMPGQAQQAPMPGMMPKPGASTPPAVVAGLERLPSQQLLQMYSQKPSLQILAALDKAYKREELGQSMRGQQAMQAAQPGTVADQVVSQISNRGIAQFSGGGAVAFEDGGQTEDFSDDPSLPLMERLRRSQKRAELSRQQGIGRSFAERFPREAEVPAADTGDESERMLRRAPARQPLFSPEAIALMRRQGPRGIASVGQPATPVAGRTAQRTQPQATAPVGIASPVEATGSSKPDALSSIEAEGIAGIKALQDIIRQQGTVDPRLAELREAAYKSSQDIAARRERDRQAALEAAQSQYGDISDLIIGAAGGAKGKTFGEVLSGAVGGAGAARTAKRAEFQKAQESARQEQNAIDQLNQALADKRVADMTGDVNQRRQADIKVAEAQLKVTELRTGIQKERALEADRGEQRQISREQIRSQERIARENRAATAALRNLPTSEQQMAKSVMDDYMAKNPGKTLSDAWNFYRGFEQRSEGVRERNEIARQNLLAKDQGYQIASMRYNNATDPVKKAQAAAVMREIERRNGIVTEDEQTTSAATQLPAGVKVTRVGP